MYLIIFVPCNISLNVELNSLMILSIFKLIYNYDLRSFTISLISQRLLLIFIAEAGEVGGVGPKLLAMRFSTITEQP